MLKTLFTAAALMLSVGCSACQSDPVLSDDTHTEIEPTSTGFLLLDACSFGLGDNACNFQLRDQDNNLWRLSTHMGDLVLIDLSAMWCGPCQYAATTAQHVQDLYEAQGFHYVTILVDDEQGNPVELSDLSFWATNFGITSAPVLQGSHDMLQSGGPSYGFPVTSWPTFILINRNQEVVWGMKGFNEATLIEAIEQYL